MKTVALLFALLGMARYCTKPKQISMPIQNTHKEKLSSALQSDLQSEDSLQRALAEKFMQSLTTEYSTYQPDSATMAGLKPVWSDSVEVKVIGGNWCSDTRRELPRLCRVLDGLEAKADKFGYFKVNKDKKPIQKDFAAEETVSRVPTVFVYKDGKLVGQIVETPAKSWEKDLLELFRKL
jgi:thiol-disulfide isomerase/thioredoxin